MQLSVEMNSCVASIFWNIFVSLFLGWFNIILDSDLWLFYIIIGTFFHLLSLTVQLKCLEIKLFIYPNSYWRETLWLSRENIPPSSYHEYHLNISFKCRIPLIWNHTFASVNNLSNSQAILETFLKVIHMNINEN